MAPRAGTKSRSILFAAATLCIAGLALAGCATPATTTGSVAPTAALQQKAEAADAADAARYTVAPGLLRPDGTLGNGLLPEPWGETS
jgi:hypothetical protein